MTNKTNAPTIESYLLLFQLRASGISVAELQRIADEVGFDRKFVPEPKDARNAWELATNLGKGVSVDPPEALANKIEAEHGVRPMVYLKSVVINSQKQDKDGNPQFLKRGLVREVILPIVDREDMTEQEIADRTLDSQVVAFLFFDDETKRAWATKPKEVSDPGHWVNGNLAHYLGVIQERLNEATGEADPQAIRHGIRSWLDRNNAKLMSSGGAYALPGSRFAENADGLTSLKAYIDNIGLYHDKKQRDAGRRRWEMERISTCRIIAVAADDPHGFNIELSLDIREDVADALMKQSQDLITKLRKGKDRKGVRREKLEEEVFADKLKLQADIREFEESFQISLRQLETVMTLADSAIDAFVKVTASDD